MTSGRPALLCRDDVVLAEQQHRAIVDAIERHEGSRAEALAREHTRLAGRLAQLQLERHWDLNSNP